MREALREGFSLRSAAATTAASTARCFKSVAARAANAAADNDMGDEFPLTPEQREYLVKIIQALYDARFIIGSYNIVILVLIIVFALLHWRETLHDRRKWLALRSRSIATCTHSTTSAPPALSSHGDDGVADSVRQPGGTFGSSSSSSTTDIAATALLPAFVDVERLPLLGEDADKRLRSSGWSAQRRRTALTRKIKSWLARQPPPLPVVNRVLPSNGTSVFIGAWLALNVFLIFLKLPFRWDFFFIFADRAGLIFVVNLPLLYLLGAKNQPLRHLTGYSYEALNIFHRRVGEWMCFVAVVHFVSMVIWQFVLMEDWLKATHTPREYFGHPLIMFGLGALASYELLFFTSLASFRQRWYELFLASHVVLQAGALVFLWLHYETSRPYVAVALVIFLVDRLVWRLSLKRAAVTADLQILEDGQTYLLSADWDIIPSPSASRSKSRWWQCKRNHSVIHGWQPTDHVFLTVPVLGRSHALQAHPFTIASAAPKLAGIDGDDVHNITDTQPTHAWFSLLIRAHDGFTADLLRYAELGHSRVPVTLDGPYGSSHALQMLQGSSCAILVAGGSGIAVTFPLVWALLHQGCDNDRLDDEDEDDKVVSVGRRTRSQKKQRVHMMWVIHSPSHQDWMPEDQLDELVSLGLELVIPEPTVLAGRPDVAGYVRGVIEKAAAEEGGGGDAGVVASGPDGLNRTVRNACADAVGDGFDVRIAVEKFGW